VTKPFGCFIVYILGWGIFIILPKMKFLSGLSRYAAVIIIMLSSVIVLNSCESVQKDQETGSEDHSLLKSTVHLHETGLPFEYEGRLSRGGLFEITVPENWDGKNILIYAHDHVYPGKIMNVPHDSVDGRSVKEFVNALGWGFAASSYSVPEMAINQAVKDIVELRDSVLYYISAQYIFLAGPSEGGLVTVLTLERYPDLFSGGLAACCPVGSLYRQIQYLGDFHVLFNWFFADELEEASIDPGNPSGVPEQTVLTWKNGDLRNRLAGMLAGNENKIAQILSCVPVPADRNDPAAVGKTIMDLLHLVITKTNEMNSLLEGCAYNNQWPRRWYFGSKKDWQLNRSVQRIKTEDFEQAKNKLGYYETTGTIEDPLITIHTTGDPLVLYWHQTIFRSKIFKNRATGHHSHMAIARYGHCKLEEYEILAGLAALVNKATNHELVIHKGLLNSEEELLFIQKATEQGASPVIIP